MKTPSPRVLCVPGLKGVGALDVQYLYHDASLFDTYNFEYNASGIFGDPGPANSRPSTAIPEVGEALLGYLLEKWKENTARPIMIIACDFGGIILKHALCHANPRDISDHQGLLDTISTLIFVGAPHRETPRQPWEYTVLRMISYIWRDKRHRLYTWVPDTIQHIALQYRTIAPVFNSLLLQFRFRIIQYVQDSMSKEYETIFPLEISRLGPLTDHVSFVGKEYDALLGTLARHPMHRKKFEMFMKDSRHSGELLHRRLLNSLETISYPELKEPDAPFDAFPTTAKGLFDEPMVKEWLDTYNVKPLGISTPSKFSTLDIRQICYSLRLYLVSIHEEGFQSYTVLSANISQFADPRGYRLSTTIISSLLRQLTERHPAVVMEAIGPPLFNQTDLDLVFCGSSAALLEATLWRCFKAAICAQKNIICTLLIEDSGIDLSGLQPILDDLVNLSNHVDANFKLLVICPGNSTLRMKFPTYSLDPESAKSAIRDSFREDLVNAFCSPQGFSVPSMDIKARFDGGLEALDRSTIGMMMFTRSLHTFDATTRAYRVLVLELLAIRSPKEPVPTLLDLLSGTGAHLTSDVLLSIGHAFDSLFPVHLSGAEEEVEAAERKDSLENVLPMHVQQALVAYLCSPFASQRPPQHESAFLISLTRLCLQCINLATRFQGQPESRAEADTANPESEQPLLDYAVINWPIYFLAVLSGTENEGDSTHEEVMNVLEPNGAKKWLSRWATLHFRTRPINELTLRLSPMELRKGFNGSDLSLHTAISASIAALDALPSCNWDADLAGIWGLLKAAGTSHAAERWRQSSLSGPKEPAGASKLLSLFGLSPSLAFHLLKEVEPSYIGENLTLLLAVTMRYGNDIVWRYIEETPDITPPIIRATEGRLHLIEHGVIDGGRMEDVVSDGQLHLYDPNRPSEAVGLSEFFARAGGNLGALFPHLNHQARRISMHAAVTSGNPNAVDALLDIGLDFDSDQEMTADTMIRLASNYGFSSILQRLLSAFNNKDLNAKDPDGATPLHLAASRGYVCIASTLLRHGASLSVQDHNSVSPFLGAVRSGNPYLVRNILAIGKDQGVDIPTSTGNEDTIPIMAAMKMGSLSISTLLLESGAELSPDPRYADAFMRLALKIRSGSMVKYALERYTQPFDDHKLLLNFIEEAGDLGFLECVTVLLDAGGSDLDAQSVLEHASRRNQVGMVKILTKRGLPQIALDEALQYAAIYNNLVISELLLDAGANMDYLDTAKNSALHLAARYNSHQVLELLLLRRPDLDLKVTGEGSTALIEGVRYGDFMTTKLLTNAGADVNASDDNGYTAFDLAKNENREDVMLLLLSKLISEPNGKEDVLLRDLIVMDSEKLVEHLLSRLANLVPSAQDLLTAVEPSGGNSNIVKLLLKHGADPNDQTDKYHGPPIHYAAKYSKPEVIAALLDSNNPKGKADVNKTGGYTYHALYTCLRNANDDSNNFYRTWDLLINNGADPTTNSGHRGTAIHIAALSCTIPIIEYILAHSGPKTLTVDTKDNEDRVPGHFAAGRGMRTVYPIFLTKELIKSRDKHGRLPLHMAAAQGSLRGLHYISGIAEPDMIWETDNDGWNALHWACRQDDSEVVDLVLKWAMTAWEDGGSERKDDCGRRHFAPEAIEGWLPRDIALLHGNEQYLDMLERHHQVQCHQGEGEDCRQYQDVPLTPWERSSARCDSCLAGIYGERHHCTDCLDFDLCFKCFRRVDQTHIYDPPHVFETL